MKINKILEKHKRWLDGEDNGKRAGLSGANLRNADLRNANLRNADLSDAGLRNANLRNADLSGANLSYSGLRGADLSYADLSDANLSYAGLSGADLRNADLSDADLSDAGLRGADLRGADLSYADLSNTNLRNADLSGAKNVLSQIDFIKNNFETTKDGVIVYKTFNSVYESPEKWVIQQGSVITENVNFDRTNDCGCGINVAPLKWVKKSDYGKKDIWKCLIRWEWLCGVCVPYNTDGKIRCEKLELLEIVEEDELLDEVEKCRE